LQRRQSIFLSFFLLIAPDMGQEMQKQTRLVGVDGACAVSGAALPASCRFVAGMVHALSLVHKQYRMSCARLRIMTHDAQQ
jgi:hypothetical protein